MKKRAPNSEGEDSTADLKSPEKELSPEQDPEKHHHPLAESQESQKDHSLESKIPEEEKQPPR